MFWKRYKLIMLFIVVAVVLFDVTTILIHNHRWSDYCSERNEAVEAGYDKEYTVCSREGNIVLNGVEYLHFHAHRAAIIDGDYNEELLVRSDSEYLDKVPDQTEDLILFGKKESTYHDLKGTSYTIIHLYSICDFSIKNDDGSFFGFVNGVIVTFAGIILEIILILIFVIHKIMAGFRKKC